MPTASLYPLARRDQLIVEQVQDEVLVYDHAKEQASCLNPTAASVWKYCDGKTSPAEIAAKMSQELGNPVDVRMVWYALEQLDKKHLLAEPLKMPKQYGGMTRRDFLVKAGLVGTAVAIPIVISLVAPTPAMAVTCGQACTGGPAMQGTCTAGCLCSALAGGTCLA